MSLYSKLAPDRYRENEYDLLLIYTLTRYSRSFIQLINRSLMKKNSQQITQLKERNNNFGVYGPRTAIPVNDRILWLLQSQGCFCFFAMFHFQSLLINFVFVCLSIVCLRNDCPAFCRRKAFEASLQSRQWKVSSADVKFTRKPLDARSIVRDKSQLLFY